MNTDQINTAAAEFESWAAAAFFASAWADAEEEAGQAKPGEIMARMPSNIDPAALHAGRTLRMDMERMNGRSVAEMMAEIESTADGDRPATLECFGHYSAMQAMGHGVGLGDAFGNETAEKLKVPYCEFGSHSLEKDYF